MNKNIMIGCIVSLVLSGCSIPLTSKGQSVRVVTNINTKECKSLGFVAASASFGLTPGDNMQSSINKLKNKVAEKGGDSLYLMSNQPVGILNGQAVSSGEALKCRSYNS